ncbi:MAG: RsmB/NOP family class I SAM-dependent RNA methyltransferase [Candidatus Bathyarchaeota archaeon]|nr:RsmB/NOP family class I SAM-dependent RNA methyltransferase [Candidatus Bathyarchaeota archaeon]
MLTLAVESLSWIELERLNEDAAIRKTVKQLKIDDKTVVDEARKLVYETMRRLNAIDFLVDAALEPDNLGNLQIGLRSFLRLYTYIVHYSDEPLAYAYELVDHMRTILRKREYKPAQDIPDLIPLMSIPFNEISDTQRLAYKYFHPSWYVTELFNEFGEQQTEHMLEYIEYPSYLRVNTLKPNSDSLDALYEKGFQLVQEPQLPDTYRILDEEGLTDTPEYRDGHFIIQDKASILAGIIADPKPDDLVLDICAAPGVKTSHYAQLMKNTGRILSIDYNHRRLQNWEYLMERLSVTNAKPIQADASKPDTLPKIEADLVVIDPPCSGTGLFHKTPSSKWRLTPHSIENMANLQKRILWNASRHLREGGTLVYSTCSVTVEENEEVVKTLLDRDPEYRLVEASPRIGDHGRRGLDEAQRLYSYKHGSNGFFIAKLVKNK